MNTSRVSKYLLRSEYECSCCGGLPPDLNLLMIKEPYSSFFMTFNELRKAWGGPLPVSSGYRCPEYNQRIGGSPVSVHLWGLALDINCSHVDEVGRLERLVEKNFTHLRMGVYKDTGTFIHIDVGFKIYPRASRSWVKYARWYK